MDEWPCYYCGDEAECIDHLIPFKVRQCGKRNGTHLGFGPRVRACKDCNSILGAVGIFTLDGRKEFIATKLKKKLKKLQSIPHWSEEELAELGYSLRSHVESGLAQRDALLRRYEVASLLRWETPEEFMV